MKKMINQVDNVVKEQLQGIAKAHPELEVNLDPMYIVRGDRKAAKVALISGGGSGHEPMHGGFVGKGMLDGACQEKCLPRQHRIRCMNAARRLILAKVFCSWSKTIPVMY